MTIRPNHIHTIMLAMLLCGCSAKTGRQADVVADGSVSTELTAEDYEALAHTLQQRVAAMYDDVFSHYSRDDYASWSSTMYFSDSLQRLWDELPDDDLVIDVDPWTYAQDYDTLAYKGMSINIISADTATADVMLFLSKNWPVNTISLSLVREQHAGHEADWYVDDFRHEDYSVAKVIRDYIKEYK